jgi:1,4-dihydroxy-2-naphthoate octaprenyltransferase
MKNWLKAFRLRTLPLSFSNILLGSALAYFTMNYWDLPEPLFENRPFSWTVFALTLLTTLLLQILSNLANDYGDAKKGADNEDRIGPQRTVQSGAISLTAMFRAIVITSFLSLSSGIALLLVAFKGQLSGYFIGFVLLGIAAIAAAIKYTVGKRAYGYAGLGDLFVFIFFGLVGVIGTFYLQTLDFNWKLVFPATTMGCFSVAVLNLNNMRDRSNDARVNKNTLAVKLGFKKSKIYHFILFIIAYAVFPIPILYAGLPEFPILLISIVPVFILHFLHLRRVLNIKNPIDFDPELKKIALSAFLFSLLFFLTILYVL